MHLRDANNWQSVIFPLMRLEGEAIDVLRHFSKS